MVLIIFKCFSASTEMITLLLSSILLMWCTTLFLQMLTHSCIPGINPTWSWHMILLMYYSILFANIFVRVFASMFSMLIKDQFSSVTQSCLTLCDPINCSMPGLPVHYQLPELTQTHVHLIGDDIQPSHLLSSSSPPAPNPSQHQGLFILACNFVFLSRFDHKVMLSS